MNGTARNVLRAGLLAVSTALLIVGGLATSQYRKATAFGPLFADPYSLAVDDGGNLYCGVEFERIHKYSPEGKMVGAWSVDGGLRPFRLRVARDSSIEVATSDGKLLRFNNVGKTISSSRDPGAFERFGSSTDREVRTASGVHYAIEKGSIVRRGEGTPQAVWVPAPKWPLRWIRTPVPLSVLLVVGPIGMLWSIVMLGSGGGQEETRGTPQ